MNCSECGTRPAETGSDTCFRCRVLSVGYVWRGGGHLYGKANFAERTNAEYVAEHIGDVKRPGIAHLGSREYTG